MNFVQEKTCLLKKILDKNFDLKINITHPTIQYEYYVFKRHKQEKNENSFLEPNCHERYHSNIWNFTIERVSEISFDNIIYCINKIKQHLILLKVDIIKVANKCDLERKIDLRRIDKFEKTNNFGINYIFYETALTGERINECLEILINKIAYK